MQGGFFLPTTDPAHHILLKPFTSQHAGVSQDAVVSQPCNGPCPSLPIRRSSTCLSRGLVGQSSLSLKIIHSYKEKTLHSTPVSLGFYGLVSSVRIICLDLRNVKILGNTLPSFLHKFHY